MTNIITDEAYPVHYDPPPMVRGADWQALAFQLMENDGVTPKDVTDYTAALTLMADWNGEVYDTLIIGDGITLTAASGLFNISRTKEDIDAYDFQRAVYKFIVTNSSGDREGWFIGTVQVVG
jgi:hypothetical protein